MIVPIKNNLSSYTTEALYQWDINQPLIVTGLEFEPTIHFCNRKCTKALAVTPTYDPDGKTATVLVPNELLFEPYNIKAYICQTDGDTTRTVYEITIPVLPRTQPDI